MASSEDREQTAGFWAQLREFHPRNARLVVLDGLLFGGGFAAFTPYTILPAFLKHFTDSPVVINSVVASFMLGLFGTGLVSCWLYDGHSTRREAMLRWSFMQRSLVLLFVPIALFSSRLGGWVVPVFLVVYGLSNVAWGMSAALWQELLGRWLVDEARSVVVGTRFLSEQTMSILCGLGFIFTLRRVDFPLSYSVIFFFGALFWWGCHTTLCFTREAVYPVTNGRRSFREYLGDLGRIMRADSSFRHFILFVVPASGGAVGGALYTTFPMDRFMADAADVARDSYAGVCNVVTGLSFALGAAAAGQVSRTYGNRAGLIVSVVCSILAAVSALTAPSLTTYYATFVFHGLSTGFFVVCLVSAMLLFSSVESRLRYIAVCSTVRGVSSAVYSLLGGMVAERWGARYAFVLTACAVAGALPILRWWTVEKGPGVTGMSRPVS